MNKKIYRKSIEKKFIGNIILLSFTISFLLVAVTISFRIHKINRKAKNINSYTAKLIECNNSSCNIEKWVNDINRSDFSPDFIIHKSGFFIEISDEYLDSFFAHSDTTFLEQFNEPKIYKSITQEEWLLYTDTIYLDGEYYYIMLGVAKRVPWRLFEIKEDLKELLKTEMEKIKKELKNSFQTGKKVDFLKGQIRADAFQIVRKDGKVMNWGWGIPAFLPKDYLEKIKDYKLLFFKKLHIHFDIRNLSVVLFRIDETPSIYLISGEKLGSVYDLLTIIILFTITSIILNVFFKDTLIKKIILETTYDISLQEALKIGENEFIAFKPKDCIKLPESLLKSIVSIANTNGGVIFIGIKDNGILDPITIRDIKEVVKIKNKLLNAIKNSISPPPLVEIEENFIDNSKVILKLKVGRFYHLPYSLNGIFYRRLGKQDVPMDLYYLHKIKGQYKKVKA
jgi:hypothetical protein